jgi:two-component system, response regulator
VHGGRSILLVEDNADDVELALRAFRKVDMPANIEIARDGAVALQYILGDAPLPVLVLLDLQLPKVHGLDVLRRMRSEQRTRRVPVVILTSSSEMSDIQASYELGANSFIRKPVDYARFIDTASILKTYWLRTIEPPT